VAKAKPKPKTKRKRKQAVGKAVVGARTTGTEEAQRAASFEITEVKARPATTLEQPSVERGSDLSPAPETQSQEGPKPKLPLLLSQLQFVQAGEDSLAEELLEEPPERQLIGFCRRVQGFLSTKFFNVEVGPEDNVLLLDGVPVKFCHLTARGFPTKQLCWIMER